MNKLNLKKWALFLGLSVFLFSSCGDDGGDDKPAATNNNGGGGGTTGINKYKGSGSYGDLIAFDIDQTNSTYTARNSTTGVTENNSFEVLDAALEVDSVIYDVYEGIYEVTEADLSKTYAVEIGDRLLAGNFSSGNSQNEIFLAVEEADYTGRESEIVGTYFYVALVPGQQSSGDNEWGMFSIDSEGEIHGFGTSSVAPGDTTVSVPLDSANASFHDGYFGADLELDGDELYIIEDGVRNSDIVGYVYIGGESTTILFDQGDGNGTYFAFKSDLSQANGNEDFAQYEGNYKYVDFYRNSAPLDKGAGNFTVYENGGTRYLDYSLIGWDKNNDEYYVDVTADVVMDWTGFPGIYQSDNWDGNGSTLYHVFAGDLVMYFDYNSSGLFEGYGVGGKLD